MRRTRRKANRSNGARASNSSLCNLCVLCVSVVSFSDIILTTEDTEVAQRLLDREVFGLRMVDNNSRSRLFWLQLKLLAQFNADARRIEEGEKLLLIFESRTRRITEAETRALIFLLEQSRQLRRILSCDTELFTNPFVPKLCESFCTLDTQTVEVEIV